MSHHPSHRYPVEIVRRRVPVGGEILELRCVRDIDALIDRMTPSEIADEKLPYYGQLWPASIALARWLWRRPDLAGKEILDLGCGVGLQGIVAARKGAKLVFADYFPEALDLARENARSLAVKDAEFLHLDWRDRDFFRRFDVILASDVLYEARNHEPIRLFLQRALRPSGEAVIADPLRPNSKMFFESVAAEFAVRFEEIPVQDKDVTITVSIAQMKRRNVS